MSNPDLARLTSSTTINECLEVVYRDGGVIIEGLFSDEVIDGLNADLQPVLNAAGLGEPTFYGSRTRRCGGIFARSKYMIDVALNPLYRAVAEAILVKPEMYWLGTEYKPIAAPMQIGVTQAIQIWPGQQAQPLHRDDIAFLWRHPQYGREARVQIMVALSEFTADNGGTLVIPGSNHWPDDRQPLLQEAIPARMQPGSALIWVGSLYHAGGENRADEPRSGLTMTYDMGNVRAEENHFLTYSLDCIRSLPEKIREGLGWGKGHDYLGFVTIDGQMTNPKDLLASSAYTAMGVGLPEKL